MDDFLEYGYEPIEDDYPDEIPMVDVDDIDTSLDFGADSDAD